MDFGSRKLLDDVNFFLNEGDKTGIIGINGTGKSTFLKILAGSVLPDAGNVTRNPNVQISMLSQNPECKADLSVLDYVLESCPPEYREVYDYEAKTMLSKLGINDFTQKTGTLSGGQRKRAALAAALIHPSDILILDEPTNHLDTEMITWLEDYLRRFKGGLVMVTHDRYFLENVSNHITEISRGKLYHYEANYSRYLELKTQREDMESASERKRQSILRTEREWIMRGCRARSTKSKDRIERYEELSSQSAPETDDNISISAASSRLGKKLITLDHVEKSFADNTVIEDFSYTILRNDRIGIVGSNGAGKSTLLKIIAGDIIPDNGNVEFGSTVKIGHFAQEWRDLDPDVRVFDFIHDISSEVKTANGIISAKTMMERFLFPSDLQGVHIGRLSGGEKRRLYLLSILMSAPNILLLDEPTNDLDIMTLSILEDYLQTFPGPVITVSHDRFLLDKLAERIFEVRDGNIFIHNGNWSEWHSKTTLPSENDNSQNKNNSGGKAGSGTKKYRGEHQKKLKFTFSEQREFSTIDDDIAILEEDLRKCTEAQKNCASDFIKLQELLKKQSELENELELKTERWIYLQELKEKIDAQSSISQ